MTSDYCAANRRAWDELARRGYPSTVPYDASHLARARELLDPAGWIPWGEIRRVLRPGGYYPVEHANPVTLQFPELDAWDGGGYRLVRPQTAPGPIDWLLPDSGTTESIVACRHYIHSLDDLIGGLGNAGFVVLRFAERAAADLDAPPGTYAHLAAYVPPFFTILARRADVTGTQPSRGPRRTESAVPDGGT